MTPQPNPDVLAWEEWKKSPQGLAATHIDSFVESEKIKKFLINRLACAFMAGVKAGREGKCK